VTLSFAIKKKYIDIKKDGKSFKFPYRKVEPDYGMTPYTVVSLPKGMSAFDVQQVLGVDVGLQTEFKYFIGELAAKIINEMEESR
jgi:hypothetical protein